MRVYLDGMGGDNAPAEIVKGAVEASKIIDQEIVITGDQDAIEKELKKYSYNNSKISVIHTTEVIENDDSPVKAIRRKKDSSMAVGLDAVKDSENDIFISAGNTGALLAGSLFIIGRIKGIDRPALAGTLPVLGENRAMLLLDSGANSECKPNNLLEFGVMGSIYVENVLNIANPKVGLINMGTEEGKGTTVLKAAYQLLKENAQDTGALNFIGNVEARDFPKGVCDVAVCDGLVGNVVLKLTEGVAWTILKMIRAKFTSGGIAKLGAALLKGKLNELKSEFDYSEYGGAPVLGVKKPVIKIHGSSSANAVKNSIIKGIPFAERNVVGIIEQSVIELDELEL